MPQQVREAVTDVVLGTAGTVDGRRLAAVRMAAPVAADHDRDYRPLQEIEILNFTHWEE